jgi:hypothetical protein
LVILACSSTNDDKDLLHTSQRRTVFLDTSAAHQTLGIVPLYLIIVGSDIIVPQNPA